MQSAGFISEMVGYAGQSPDICLLSYDSDEIVLHSLNLEKGLRSAGEFEVGFGIGASVSSDISRVKSSAGFYPQRRFG